MDVLSILTDAYQGGQRVITGNPVEVFYGECLPGDAAIAAKLIKPHSEFYATTSSHITPAWKEADFDDRRAYLVCNKDAACPPEFQRYLMTASGVEWESVDIDADHSPFLSRTEQTADWIAQKAKQYSAM